MGPLKYLTISKIKNKYPLSKNQKKIIFYGASNFALWHNMENDLMDFPVQNHGFDGSTDKDLMQYAEELLYKITQ